MSDLFQDGVPTDFICQVCDVMMLARHHQFQVLTKRHERLQALLSDATFADVADARHIFWGVSAEDQKYGLPRIEALRQTPLRNRFISFEPLLEGLERVDLSGIGWIIVGGESGTGARPFAMEWAESLIAQGHRQGVPVFIKQMGRKPILGGQPFKIIGQNDKTDLKGVTMESWPDYLRVREFPGAFDPPAALQRESSGLVRALEALDLARAEINGLIAQQQRFGKRGS
jgi:protein gp37